MIFGKNEKALVRTADPALIFAIVILNDFLNVP